MADTANYNITKPVVGGSVDAWGTILNTALDDVDTQMKVNDDANVATQAEVDATEIVADGALQRAGGVMTGRIDALTGAVKVTSHASATGALALDLALSNWFKLNLTGTLQPTASNVPGTSNFMDVLVLDITINAYDVTDWSGLGTIEWAGGSAPTLNAHDVVLLITYDGGTNWQGSLLQKNLS